MATNMTFVDFVTPVPADWLNNVNAFVNGGSGTFNYTAPYTGAVTRNLIAKIGETVSVTDFGAAGQGADDTTFFQLAINALPNGGKIFVPKGTYKINPGGFSLLSNQWLCGDESGASILTVTGNQTAGIIIMNGISNFIVSDLTINGAGSTSAGIPNVTENVCTNFIIERCNFINFDKFGLSINGGVNFIIQDNYFNFPTPISTQNQALNISVSGGGVTNAIVTRNTLIGSAMDIAGSYLKIIDNYINTWKFGAGITVEVGTEEIQVIGNTCIGGRGNDVNSTVCLGIENWATRSLIANNLCVANDGDGIDNGGQNNVIANNICFNNGQYLGGGSGSGIVTRWSSGSQNGNNSVVVGNVCYDTNGVSGTQSYGYADQNTNVARVTLEGNFFNQNRSGSTNIQGSTMDVRNPQLWGIALSYSAGTLANGASAGGGITVSGAALGDLVSGVSFSTDLQGVKLFAWVSGANTVTFRMENNTGSSISLGTGNVRVKVEKIINYTQY